MKDFTNELQKYVPSDCKIDKVVNKNYYIVTVPHLDGNYLVIDVDEKNGFTLEDDYNLCETLNNHELIPSDTQNRMDWFNDVKYTANIHDFEIDCAGDMEDEDEEFKVTTLITLDDIKQGINDYIDLYNDLTKLVLA